MALRGVLFDMGGTLLHYDAPNTTWKDSEQTGARGVYALLQSQGWTLPPEDEALETAWEMIFGAWKSLDQRPPAELKLHVQVAALLNRWGLNGAGPALVNDATQAYMRAVQVIVHPLDGAAEMLRSVRERGLRVGLVSNSFWPGENHRHDLERWGLMPYLEVLVFSSDAGVWKPHQGIFQQVLDTLGLQPHEAAFVGDSLYFDVWGGQQAGMRSVWVEKEIPWLPEGMIITPDATIRHLSELRPLFTAWQDES